MKCIKVLAYSALILFAAVFSFFIILGFVRVFKSELNPPYKQPGTVWQSSDNTMSFSVAEEYEKRGTAPWVEVKGEWQFASFETNMHGTITRGDETVSFFAVPGAPNFFCVYSNDMPDVAPEGVLYSDLQNQYLLCCFIVNYISTKHFKATVYESNIPEIEVGQNFNFYRTAMP